MEYIAATLFIILLALANRLIGHGDFRKEHSIERWMIYLAVGLLSGGLVGFLGGTTTDVAYLFLGAPIGYMAYRQLGPDIAFFAGHQRNYPTKFAKWLKVLCSPFFDYDIDWIAEKGNDKQLLKLGLIGGAFRGSLLLVLGAIMCYFHWSGLLFSTLGLTFGGIHYIMGKNGPFGTEEGMRERAEYVSGAIVAITIVGTLLVRFVWI